MSLLSAFFFGIVQGITEFVPVSSSAHLSVLFNLFGISRGFNTGAFSVFLHLGSFIAVLIVYRNDYIEMVLQTLELLSGADTRPGKRGPAYPAARLLLMMLASLLMLLLLLPMNRYLANLEQNNYLIGVMLIFSGVVLYIADKMKNVKKSFGQMTFLDAIIIGICQSVAAIPGLSRTGVTMTAGLSLGVNRDFSYKYALLLSAPVILVSNIIRLVDASAAGFYGSYIPPCLAGLAGAVIAGIAAIKIMQKLISSGTYKPLGYYCCVAGVLSVILTMIF